MSRIEIKQEGTITHVFLDGKEIHNIREINFKRDTSYDAPVVQLDILATDMNISLDSYILRAGKGFQNVFFNESEIAKALEIDPIELRKKIEKFRNTEKLRAD